MFQLVIDVMFVSLFAYGLLKWAFWLNEPTEPKTPTPQQQPIPEAKAQAETQSSTKEA